MLRIGVFDSGIGGLTVLRECVRLLPRATFYYLGDNRRAPYGSRPAGEIVSFTREALSFFRKEGVDAAVLACNTATAVCAAQMRGEFSFPVIGTEPAVLPAARAAQRVLVLCTPRTAVSVRLCSLLSRCPDTHFTVFGAPRLAAAVEERMRGGTLSLSDHLPAGNYGAVVLGCTHYAFLKEEISAFYSAPVFDSAAGVARRLFSLLEGDADDEAGIKNHICKVLNKNKSLQKMTQKNIYFVGNDSIFNESVYTRMFIFDI